MTMNTYGLTQEQLNAIIAQHHIQQMQQQQQREAFVQQVQNKVAAKLIVQALFSPFR